MNSLRLLLFALIFSVSLRAEHLFAGDWGFQANVGANDNTIALSYANKDNDRMMREWTLSYRQYERRNVAGHSIEQAEGPGISVSWRYYPAKARPLFIGVRNDWSRLVVRWEKETGEEGRVGRLDVLQPKFLLGWTVGDEKFSTDFYFSLGYDFNVQTQSHEQLSQGPAAYFGIALRF